MVKKRMIKGAACLAAVLMLSAMGGGSTSTALAEGKGPDNGPEDLAGDTDPDAVEDGRKKTMHGPQIPPAGEAYDEWKKLEYTSETEFNLRTYWGIRLWDRSDAEAKGYTRIPEASEGVLTFIDAHAEPVGGEMKLRSGGYVDITVTVYWTTQLAYLYDQSGTDRVESIGFHDPNVLPFDRYTGACLLNYSDTAEGKSIEGIYTGEAVDSGFVESDVVWKERTFRLFAREDSRNPGGGGWDHDYQGEKVKVTANCAAETVYTFRVPADYDGLALCIDKDNYDERPYHMNAAGEWLSTTDYYADILTDDRGGLHEPDEFYFIRVSDLLKEFEEKER